MNCEIFIVSHAPDAGYLAYCLKSITKFASGFSGVTLLVPFDQTAAFYPLKKFCDFTFREYHRQPVAVKWHLEHQLQKMLSDKWCPHASHVLHIDSDTVFDSPVTADYYFKDGKPIMNIERYDRLPPEVPWQKVVEEALAMPAPFETMRNPCQVNPIKVYADVRKRIELVHEMPCADYVMGCKPEFPWGFEEHDTIGAFAHATPRWHHEYHWVEIGKQPAHPSKTIQFWSHSPMNKEQGFSNGGTGPSRGVPLEVCMRLGLT